MFQVTWLVLTNQSALFHSSIGSNAITPDLYYLHKRASITNVNKRFDYQTARAAIYLAKSKQESEGRKTELKL